ncbi:hypothetical protein, partial [Bartonella schoenbuchensis]|uniref:hypothetical protein n=1 Tax=Bartonella schoenbuchensis TaxID=165694 RepID=UPI0031455E96
MRFFLSVKRTALLGIFISTFMFTGYAHSEQPVVTYENKPMAELRKSGPYKKAKFIGHIKTTLLRFSYLTFYSRSSPFLT